MPPKKDSKTKRGLEIERRFLLRGMPVIPSSSREERIAIRQFYIDVKGLGKFRIRESQQSRLYKTKYNTTIQDITAYDRTKKVKLREGVYDEAITQIDAKTFNRLALKAHRVISKKRYVVPHPGSRKLKWEIDVFDAPFCLILVEIELPREKYPLTLPKFITDMLIMEVTHLKEFTNYALAEQIP